MDVMEKLLTPKAEKIGRPQGAEVQADRVSIDKLNGSPAQLVQDLSAIVGPENVKHRLLDLVRYASDASPYRRVPQIVVQPSNAAELAALMRYATLNKRHLVFRAAGSSLNGQAMTDDILVDVKTNFLGMEVRADGAEIWTRPGVVLGDAQAALSRYGYMLGPDPGSTSVATIGGVIADNSGGMRCTVERDIYHSLVSAKFVLPSGTIVDSEDPAGFEAAEPALAARLRELRDEIRADQELVEFLRTKFSIRNTNGIRLDAFLDEDEPVRILMRLLVSSEGIFGAITESVIKTVKLPRLTATAWIMLPDLRQAASYVHALMSTGAQACELMVSAVLHEAVSNFPEAPAEWENIDENAAALLLEVAGSTPAELQDAIERARAVIADAELLYPVEFLTDPVDIRGAWRIRNGLLGLIGGTRPQGATLITEDVCFPPAKIGPATADLLDLLNKYDYPQLVMGHAAFGNLHFFLTPTFTDDQSRSNYASFLDDLAELVIEKYQGSLKAEHGTGTNMAPFVRREWGDRAWNLMWEVKNAIDPAGILAPDVKLTRSEDIHLQFFKSNPVVESYIQNCVECGFCEPVCPSRHVTVTPRQRIVLRREMARQPDDSPILAKLQEEYQYDAIEMCAADGSCSIACPISIDTGKVMKLLRRTMNDDAAEQVALRAAKNWKTIAKTARGALKAASFLKPEQLAAMAGVGRVVINNDLLPTVPGQLPLPAAKSLPVTTKQGAAAVYFPACINRMFGLSPLAPADRLEVPAAIVELGRRAGVPVWIPPQAEGDCCGTPWSSKGYEQGFNYQAKKIVADLYEWSDGGKLPIIVDAASCTHGLLAHVPAALSPAEREKYDQLTIWDTVEWLKKQVVATLPITETIGKVAVHPNCSTRHMLIADDLVELVQLAATEVVVPDGATCCGTAGDRGLLHPELVESATREERTSLAGVDFAAYVSDNRTCEMGLEMIAGHPYEHIAQYLERASRPVLTH